jgi:hypothetical protein
MAKTRGTQFKTLIPVAIRIQELGADPVKTLCEYLNDTDKMFRFQAAATLMPYVYPKLKNMEFTLSDVPDEVFEKEAERRVHLKILRGEKVG